jgi:hypothetical protein
MHECERSSLESSLRSSDGSSEFQEEDRWPLIRLAIAALFAALAVASATGCTRTILVPEASPIRLGPDARARVYAVDPETKAWRLSDHPVSIPEGWYCVPPSFVEDEDG